MCDRSLVERRENLRADWSMKIVVVVVLVVILVVVVVLKVISNGMQR